MWNSFDITALESMTRRRVLPHPCACTREWKPNFGPNCSNFQTRAYPIARIRHLRNRWWTIRQRIVFYTGINFMNNTGHVYSWLKIISAQGRCEFALWHPQVALQIGKQFSQRRKTIYLPSAIGNILRFGCGVVREGIVGRQCWWNIIMPCCPP